MWIPELGRTGLDHLRILIEYLFRVVDPVTRDALRAKLRVLGPDSEEITVTIADQIHEEARMDTLRSLLIYKFQALDAASEARLQTASPEAVDRYLRRLLTAGSLAEVFES